MDNLMDYLLRFLFYLTSKILLLLFLIAIIVISFLLAKDYMNINVLVSDGFSERANVVLKGADPVNLSRVFTEEYIRRDVKIQSGRYDEYIVRSYIQDVDVDFKLVMPWGKKVVIRTRETIDNIDGELPEELWYDDMPEHFKEPPKWDNAVYLVTLDRYETSWKITDVQKEEDIQ